MSTARNRFGVSILVALVLAVLLAPVPADAAARVVQPANASIGLGDDLGLGGIDTLASLTSTRTQLAVGMGAGVPLLIIGCMVRRRIYADVEAASEPGSRERDRAPRLTTADAACWRFVRSPFERTVVE